MGKLRGGSTVGGLPILGKEARDNYIGKIVGNKLKESMLYEDGNKLVINGALQLQSEQFHSAGNHAINLNNSDIIGANVIYFKDTAEGSEGMAFLKSGSSAGSISSSDYNFLRIDGAGVAWAGGRQLETSDDAQTKVNNATTEFGLGTTAKLITGRADTITKTGFYRGSNLADAPLTTGWFYIIHLSHDGGGYCTQIAYSYGSGVEGAGSAYQRQKNGGTWSGWTEMGTATSGGGGSASSDEIDKLRSNFLELLTVRELEGLSVGADAGYWWDLLIDEHKMKTKSGMDLMRTDGQFGDLVFSNLSLAGTVTWKPHYVGFITNGVKYLQERKASVMAKVTASASKGQKTVQIEKYAVTMKEVV
jgi:hypothetical protein